MTNATLPARKDFRSYFFLLLSTISCLIFSYTKHTKYTISILSILSIICNPAMCNVVLRAIFRNDDGITASGKRHYIAVRLFQCRADFRGRSIATFAL